MAKYLVSTGVRHMVAFFFTFFIYFSIPFLTLSNNSVQVNNIVSIIPFIIILFFMHEFFNGVYKYFYLRGYCLVLLFGAIFSAVVVFSIVFVGGYDRGMFYIGMLVLFFFLVLFMKSYPSFFYYVVWVKIIAILIASVFFVNIIISADAGVYKNIAIDPPIYRNIRHYNYDLMCAIGGLVFLYVSGKISKSWFFCICLFLCFMSLWTGGRGQLVALFIFMVLIFASRLYEVFWFFVLSVLFSVFVLVISDNTFLLSGQLEKTLFSEGLNRVSSGRLDIWVDSFNFANKSFFTGYGADSFRGYGIGPSFILHPHNSIIQFFFEYGVWGLVLFSAFFLWLMSLCFQCILFDKFSCVDKVLSSIIVVMLLYSLVDGIFYHAAPFSFFVSLVSALFFRIKIT